MSVKLDYFKQSLDRLDEVMKEHKTGIVRDSAIKRYEICYELAWKSIQVFLKSEGLETCNSPKQCYKKAFQLGLVTDEPGFASMIENRNLTTHAYDEKLAEMVYGKIPGYLVLFQSLWRRLGEEKNR